MEYLRIRRLGVRVPPSALHILAGQNPQRLKHDRALESSAGLRNLEVLPYNQQLESCHV